MLRESMQIEGRQLDVRGVTRGHLAVAASQTPGIYLLPVALAGFRERFPGVELQVRVLNSEQARAAVLDFSVEIGLIEGPPVDDERLYRVVDALEAVAAEGRASVSRRANTASASHTARHSAPPRNGPPCPCH